MANVTTDENIVVSRDYSDNFSIKKTMLEKYGPKYFENLDLAALNVGELGFVLEQMANITEDSFNTQAILINEAFPNKAILPESIYSHAAIFQLDNTFSKCAKCTFVMLLLQSEILKLGNTVGNRTTFFIDRKTIFSVEDIPFTFDYDIKIEALKKQITGSEVEYNYSAQYVMDFKNSISEVNDPYLKIRKIDRDHLLLQFTAHQVERLEKTDNIISNTKINYPVIKFSFDEMEGNLAGFDIFYKSPTDKNWVQLEKLIKFSLPIKGKFCYYKLKDNTTLEITFSTKEKYFQPEFNSEIKIIMYTTIGTKGMFEGYTGSDITIQKAYDVYPYNDKLTLAIKPVSDCGGAIDKMDLESLQVLTVESYSSATEISSENDLANYFYNFKYRYGNEIFTIKRRDDITERLYSAFLLMKNGEYIYPTNTLHLDLNFDEYDVSDGQNRFTFKPGHVLVYEDGSLDTLKVLPGVYAWEEDKVREAEEKYQFVFTNPFLISMIRNPNLVGIYQTIAKRNVTLDFISSNDQSFMQFITSRIDLSRSLTASPEYTLSVSIIPSSSLDSYIHNLNDYKGNDVRVIAGFCDSNGTEVGYVELLPTAINPDDETNVTFTAKLATNDVIMSNGSFAITNAIKTNEKAEFMYIPIKDNLINIYILYDNAIPNENKFTKYFDDMEYYMITNLYQTKNEPLTFIEPMNMMRSTVIFKNMGSESEPLVHTNLSLLPVIRADIINNEENFNVFIERLSMNYEYINNCMDILRNNTNIDIKFYNTYGKSNNYYIGDNQELIDRVNLSIKFIIFLNSGADDIEAKRDIKAFIKSFIEKVKSDGANDLYISNLIREIETNFASVHHLKFLGINDYDTNFQTISVKEKDLNNLTKEQRRKYVPEVLVADNDNIQLKIETS